jgi:hypothetical protein
MSDETGQNTAWYYCLKHGTVERAGECKATDRLGPYPSPEDAANALASFKEREERLDAEDRAWVEGSSGSPS